MPTENFRSEKAYQDWNAFRHIHGIPAPHLKNACIGKGKKKKCHKVKHSKLSAKKKD